MESNKILISILVMLLNIIPSSAATLNVGQGQTYDTIQSAVDAANPGDVISVAEGTYYENILVKKNGISITGKNKEKTIIDGKKTASVLRIDRANNVKVSGFTIRNSGGGSREDAGITLYIANNNTIANIIFVNNIGGISIYTDSNNNIVSGNDIKSSDKYAILIFSSSGNRIYNNNIQNNKFGIDADSARANRIYSNNIIDNSDQARDNSGFNSWDDGKSGNHWSDFKGSGEYIIPGVPKAKDNYPLSRAIAMKYETIAQPYEKTPEPAGKSSPGFSGIIVLALFIVIRVLRMRG